MKKVGIIALALVTVLATLGIGFAMWSQTITINGTVNTGNVTLQVSNYTGTVLYKEASGVGQFIQGPLAMGTTPTAPADAVWGPAYAYIHDVSVGNTDYTDNAAHSCTSGAGLTVNMVYWNLFPIPYPWTADFTITNTGSIPVKLEISPISTTDTSITGEPMKTGGMPTITTEYVDGNGGLIASLEGYELEPQGVVNVFIGLTVNESTVQSYNGTFSLQISGVQWNEYTAPGGRG